MTIRSMRLAFAVITLATIVLGQNSAPAKRSSRFFTTTDGVKLHYVEAGSGRSILLVPGFMMPAWIWDSQIDALSRKYHVIAMDPRSQSESAKPAQGNHFVRRAEDIRDLVNAKNLKNPVLVGWSMGVPELVYYAGHVGSENVGGYVLVDGFLWDKIDPQLAAGMAGWILRMQQERDDWTDKFVRGMYKKPQNEEYIRRVETAALKTPPNSAASLMYSMMAVQDWTPSISKMDKPVMFVYTPASQKTADLLKERLPATRIEIFADAGHALFVDDAERFNRLIDEFVSELK